MEIRLPLRVAFRPRFPATSTLLMLVLLVILTGYFVYPVLLIGLHSLNTSGSLRAEPVYGLDNWRIAFSNPELFLALRNTFGVFFSALIIEFPIAVLIAWVLARVRIPFSNALEFLFWIAYLLPTVSVTMGWMLMLDPHLGLVNRLLASLPFIDSAPFNIFSLAGIVWVHVVGGGIAGAVILLTPSFRNMNVLFEEASRVSGASNALTMVRVTLPLLVPPMVVVLAVRVARMFQSFEIEQLLGVPFGFFVYSTKIYELVRGTPPLYGQATALASITLVLVAVIVPLQRWLLNRRQYTTVTSGFKPGRIDLGMWTPVVFAGVVLVLVVLIAAPLVSLVMGSFMTRSGIFILTPIFTLDHWKAVLTDGIFINSLMNTLWIAGFASLVSPLVFSSIAYAIVRTKWFGRQYLDSLIWFAAVIPGMLSGLGLLWLFLRTPFLVPLYGTLVPLMLVVMIQGKTTGVQISKAIYLQIGADMEEQSRVSGAGWLRTYFGIWLPLLAPTLALLATMNFMMAANAVSSIILLAPRGTETMAILAIEFAEVGRRESAGIVSLLIMALSVGLAVVVRRLSLQARSYGA